LACREDARLERANSRDERLEPRTRLASHGEGLVEK
jgi:hypothetical protein